MRSKLAEEFSDELQTEMLSLSIEDRIRLALKLGDRAVRLYAETENIALDEARNILLRRSQIGRRFSKVASE